MFTSSKSKFREPRSESLEPRSVPDNNELRLGAFKLSIPRLLINLKFFSYELLSFLIRKKNLTKDFNETCRKFVYIYFFYF